MDWLLNVKWGEVFVPSLSPLEIFVRGSLTYLSLFVILRVVLKREAGTLGMTDLLVVVLIADAAQNAMAGEYKSVPDGVLLVATIVFWAYAIDWIAYHFPRLRRWLHPPPLPLVKDGKLLRHNMRKELVTRDELMAQLREQGIEGLAEVKVAYMEPDGRISVIAKEPAERAKARDHKGL